MKPVGLEPDITGKWPYAVVQLRKENLLGSAYNLVGFQTRLTYKEQVRVFRMIPGFAEASFIHLGSCHRNSFLNARKLLDWDLKSKKFPEVYFAGQITGVEGYTESASMGLFVALQLLRRIKGEEILKFPER
jgi:methylenetetrahydrofolate--tRNA-(uracil-5-)-methyltransferase